MAILVCLSRTDPDLSMRQFGQYRDRAVPENPPVISHRADQGLRDQALGPARGMVADDEQTTLSRDRRGRAFTDPPADIERGEQAFLEISRARAARHRPATKDPARPSASPARADHAPHRMLRDPRKRAVPNGMTHLRRGHGQAPRFHHIGWPRASWQAPWYQHGDRGLQQNRHMSPLPRWHDRDSPAAGRR